MQSTMLVNHNLNIYAYTVTHSSTHITINHRFDIRTPVLKKKVEFVRWAACGTANWLRLSL